MSFIKQIAFIAVLTLFSGCALSSPTPSSEANTEAFYESLFEGKEYDLTGYTGRCQVFPDQDGGAALFTLTSGSSGFDIPTPSNGICNLTFSAAQTANFVVGNSYYFDVRLSNGTDVIYMDPIKISVQWTGTSA